METKKKFVVSHAPYWHDGEQISKRSYHTIIAALPAVIFGISQYGGSALGVVALAMASAMIWELLMNLVTKRAVSIGDGNAAVIGLVFAMLLPPAMPWWGVITGTFVVVVVGKQIFGGMGGNPFNPVLIGMAVLTISWKLMMNFDAALINYEFGFEWAYPLGKLKAFGPSAVSGYGTWDLLMGRQTGGIGSIFGLGLIIGGVYLIIRGFIRWEISLSFLAGIGITAWLFVAFGEEGKYAGPVFHLLTGYSLIGAFFLATEDSSSPVNLIPMLIFGACAGILTVLMRNIGAYVDGVVYAILLMSVVNPLLDMIRPKALGKVVENA